MSRQPALHQGQRLSDDGSLGAMNPQLLLSSLLKSKLLRIFKYADAGPGEACHARNASAPLTTRLVGARITGLLANPRSPA